MKCRNMKENRLYGWQSKTGTEKESVASILASCRGTMRVSIHDNKAFSAALAGRRVPSRSAHISLWQLSLSGDYYWKYQNAGGGSARTSYTGRE